MKLSAKTSVTLVLASTLAYVACGSDEGGSPGDSGGTGGSSSVAGKGGKGGSSAQGGSSTAGSQATGGESGEGGAPSTAGAAGETSAGSGGESSGASGAGGEPGGGAGGDAAGGTAGAGGSPGATAHADCPSDTYPTVVEGTAGDDVLDFDPLTSGDDYADGLPGNDNLHGTDGSDCYFGNDGNDRLAHGTSEDGIDYLIGGAGADDFVMMSASAHAVITDFSAADSDEIYFRSEAFAVSGESGTIFSTYTYESESDVTEGVNGSSCSENTPCIIYDSTDGEIFYDVDGSDAVYAPNLVAVIEDYASYTLDWDDFRLE